MSRRIVTEEHAPRVVSFTRPDGSTAVFTARRSRVPIREQQDQAAGRGAVMPEMFASLVADLRAEIGDAAPLRRAELTTLPRPASVKPPRAFAGRAWTGMLVTLKEAAPLTGHSWHTLHNFARRGSTGERFGEYRLPPHAAVIKGGKGTRQWTAGDLAIWCAGYAGKTQRRAVPGAPKVPAAKPRATSYVPPAGGAIMAEILAGEKWRGALHARERHGNTGNNGSWEPRRRAVMALLRAAVREDPYTDSPQARELIAAAGITKMWPARVTRMLAEARRLEFAWMLAQEEADEEDGLLTVAQVAKALGVTPRAVYMAGRNGRLQFAGKRGGHMLLDPSRLRLRTDYRRVPVDQDHPMAAPLP